MMFAPWLVSVVLMGSGAQAPEPVRVGGAVVDGRTGAPVSGAKVTLHCHADAMVDADANGQFEFLQAPASNCQLWATAPGYLVTQYGLKNAQRRQDMLSSVAIRNDRTWTGLVLTLVRGAVITGRVQDEHGVPMAAAEVHAGTISTVLGGRQLFNPVATATTDAQGDYRIDNLPTDRYYVIVAAAPRETAEQREIFAPAVFPGVGRLRDTAPLDLNVEDERTGTDITVRSIALASIEGTISGLVSTSPPAPGDRVSLTLVRQDEASGLPTVRLGSASAGRLLFTKDISADGHFAFRDVPPGEYRLSLRQEFRNANNVIERRWGSVPVNVSGTDIKDVLLNAAPGATVRGTLTFRERPGAATLSSQIFLAPIGDSLLGTGEILSSETFSFGRFTITGVPPGRYRVMFGLSPSDGWAIANITAGNAMDASEMIDITAGEVPLAIEFSQRLPKITGTVRKQDETTASSGSVLVIAEDAQKRQPGSSFMRYAPIAEDGTFSLGGVRPGRYLIVAADETIGNEQLSNEELIGALLLHATRITVSNDALTQNLRLNRRQR